MKWKIKHSVWWLVLNEPAYAWLSISRGFPSPNTLSAHALTWSVMLYLLLEFCIILTNLAPKPFRLFRSPEDEVNSNNDVKNKWKLYYQIIECVTQRILFCKKTVFCQFGNFAEPWHIKCTKSGNSFATIEIIFMKTGFSTTYPLLLKVLFYFWYRIF